MNATAASSLSQATLMHEIGIAIAKTAQDTVRQQGDAAVSLLQDAAQTQKALSVDGSGKGAKLDVVA